MREKKGGIKMKLTVKRIYNCPSYCIGHLYIDGVYFSDTLEDTDRGLKKTWPESQIKAMKVPGATAIPKGTYAITMRVQSPKFSAYKYKKQYGFCDGYLPRLLGVPGYEGVLIHSGNYATQTDGCLLCGMNTKKGMVCNSTETFKKLYAKLKAADDRNENISITIQ